MLGISLLENDAKTDPRLKRVQKKSSQNPYFPKWPRGTVGRKIWWYHGFTQVLDGSFAWFLSCKDVMMLTSSPSIRFQRLQEHFRDSQLEVGPWKSQESQEGDGWSCHWKMGESVVFCLHGWFDILEMNRNDQFICFSFASEFLWCTHLTMTGFKVSHESHLRGTKSTSQHGHRYISVFGKRITPAVLSVEGMTIKHQTGIIPYLLNISK